MVLECLLVGFCWFEQLKAFCWEFNKLVWILKACCWSPPLCELATWFWEIKCITGSHWGRFQHLKVQKVLIPLFVAGGLVSHHLCRTLKLPPSSFIFYFLSPTTFGVWNWSMGKCLWVVWCFWPPPSQFSLYYVTSFFMLN